MNPKLDEQYLSWLYRLVEGDTEYPYWKLMNALYSTRFDYIIDLDYNRAVDGMGLREQFISEEDPDPTLITYAWVDTDCSILEMIIALVKRMEFLTDWAVDDTFWELMDNLGLSDHHDLDFNEFDVEQILERLINRTYDESGHGGLFPLESPTEDQRNLQLIYQMYSYINEFTA